MNVDTDPYRAFMPYPPVDIPHEAAGPLAGLTVAIKDIFDVAGYPTGCGCPTRLAQSGVKTTSATAAQRLFDGGARCVGKAQTDELAWSMYGMNVHFGTPVNPAAPDRIPGGSSSGSAVAVAGGLADLALGSDTGGSVRAPASFCGIWGIRPTHGIVPMDGTLPVAPGYDTPGLFARDAATLLRGAEVLYGRDAAPLPDAPRLLWPRDMAARLGPEARAIYDAAFAGVRAAEVDVYPEDADAAYRCFLTTMGADARDALLPWIRAADPPLAHGLDGRVAAAAALGADAILAARAAREAFADAVLALLGHDGVILAPVVHAAPFRLDPPAEVFDGFRHDGQKLLCVAGLAGLPQVVMPAGRIDGGPFGVSLIGPRGSDLSLVALASRLAPAVAP